ncbi:MAG: hypothetical protein ACM3VT_15365 [Solirubrobacterales bacterium]
MLTGLAGQFNHLAQGGDNWENLILLVVMVVIWLAGIIGKVLMGNKAAGQQPRQERPATQPSAQRETWQQRLARKAQEMQRAAEAERTRLEQQARVRTEPPKPRPAGEVTVRTDQKGDSVMVYQPSVPTPRQRSAPERRTREPVFSAAAPQPILEPPSIELPEVSLGPTTTAIESPIASRIDYSDPDVLTNAILAYEIFGKPLALRDPSEETSPF